MDARLSIERRESSPYVASKERVGTLGYHPCLNGEQQSDDMINALTAARSALPTADAQDTADGGKLLVTGYSQGGYVAMATHGRITRGSWRRSA